MPISSDVQKIDRLTQLVLQLATVSISQPCARVPETITTSVTQYSLDRKCWFNSLDQLYHVSLFMVALKSYD